MIDCKRYIVKHAPQAWQGEAWQGEARHGQARQGAARRGKAGNISKRQSGKPRQLPDFLEIEMAIEKSTRGIMEFCFDQIEQVQADKQLESMQRHKAADMYLRHIWNGAKIELEVKKFMTRSPELAKANDMPVMLGGPSK